MPRLSILIPCLGGAAEFDGTLVSVLSQRPGDCEVIVVHTERYDDPYELAGEVRFIRAAAGSQAELINIGWEAARGVIVHPLACGYEVEEHWAEPALRHFASSETAAVAPIVLSAASQQIAAAGVTWTLGGARRVCTARSLKVLAPTLGAGFWRRDVLTALGGFEAQLGDDLADISAGLDLRELDLKVVCEPKSRVTQTGAAAASRAANGCQAERLFRRHAGSVGQTLSLLAHPLAVATQFSPLSRSLAWLEFGALAQYRARIEQARVALADRDDVPSSLPLPQAASAKTTTKRAA